jgi:hypothetical protein
VCILGFVVESGRTLLTAGCVPATSASATSTSDRLMARSASPDHDNAAMRRAAATTNGPSSFILSGGSRSGVDEIDSAPTGAPSTTIAAATAATP